MINYYIDKSDIINNEKFIRCVDMYFKGWVIGHGMTELDRVFLREIDKSTLGDCMNTVITPFGTVGYNQISTGCKAAILLSHLDNEYIVNLQECSQEAINYIFQNMDNISVYSSTYKDILVSAREKVKMHGKWYGTLGKHLNVFDNIETDHMERVTLVSQKLYGEIDLDLTVYDSVTLVNSALERSKELIISALIAIERMKDTSRFMFFNINNESELRNIRWKRDKIILIDNADIILSTKDRKFISKDKKNHYILFGRDDRYLHIGPFNLATLQQSDNELTLEFPYLEPEEFGGRVKAFNDSYYKFIKVIRVFKDKESGKDIAVKAYVNREIEIISIEGLKSEIEYITFENAMLTSDGCVAGTKRALSVSYLEKGQNPKTIRAEHIDRIRKAYIMFEETAIAELYHEYSSLSGESDWIIRPLWDNWDRKIKEKYFDIAGIDETLRKEEYVRNYTPSFVTQRVIPEGRRDLRKQLDDIHLRSYDLFEILCRTHGICGNDDLYVSRKPDIIVNVHDRNAEYDIPDFNTDCYGWIQADGTISDYKEADENTINCLRRM